MWIASSTRQAVQAGAWGEGITVETAEAVDGGGGPFAPPSQPPPVMSRSGSLTGTAAGAAAPVVRESSNSSLTSNAGGECLLWIVLPLLAAVLPLAPPAAQQSALTKASRRVGKQASDKHATKLPPAGGRYTSIHTKHCGVYPPSPPPPQNTKNKNPGERDPRCIY